MVKVTYQQSNKVPDDEIEVRVTSNSKTPRVNQLLDYLTRFNQGQTATIPIKADDQFVIIKTADLLMVEVNQRELTFHTKDQVITTTGRLKDVQVRLTATQFVQVSRYAIVNMDYLQSVENSFSGTMIAKLAPGVKTTISRKYVPVIKEYLGL